MLHSLKAVTEETPTATRRLRRSSPDPGLGPQVELSGRDASGLLDLFGIGKTLTRQGITAEEPPPTLLQVQPARPGGDENVMDAGMIDKRGPRLEAGMTTEIVGDNEEVACGVVGFDISEQGDIAFRVA